MKKPPAAAAPVPQVTQATLLQDKTEGLGLLVKREDLACAEPGPPSGRMRGVYPHAARLVRGGVKVLGVLDGGRGPEAWAVAYAARLLGVACVVYFPTGAEELTPSRAKAAELGAEMVTLGVDPAYVSALHQAATNDVKARQGHLMPPGLKLSETTDEVAAEVLRTFETATRDQFEHLRRYPWVVSQGSAAVAAGVIQGLVQALGRTGFDCLVHLPQERAFPGPDLAALVALSPGVKVVDERYTPGEKARWAADWPRPDWPLDDTDLKALTWWLSRGRSMFGQANFWSVG